MSLPPKISRAFIAKITIMYQKREAAALGIVHYTLEKFVEPIMIDGKIQGSKRGHGNTSFFFVNKPINIKFLLYNHLFEQDRKLIIKNLSKNHAYRNPTQN